MVTGMKKESPRNRLVGNMPKVGIRPVIDGRRRGISASGEGLLSIQS
jgi:L-fucose isomerase